MALNSNPMRGFTCREGCGCDSCKPDVARFAEQLDAVGGPDAKVTFSSRVPLPLLGLEATRAEATTYDLGSRPRGTKPVDVVMAHHTISESSFSIVTVVRDAPPTLLPDEIEAIVSDLTRRHEAMLRAAIYGGDPK